MMTEHGFGELLRSLVESQVSFILVGGLAGMAHGSSRATVDVDVVYDRSDENINRIISALLTHEPYLRGAPPGLPFQFDAETIRRGLNFTLTTKIGELDLLGEVAGGNYKTLLGEAEPIIIFGLNIVCVSLPQLIRLKRAAGRPKDLEAIAELEAIQEEKFPPSP